MCILGSGFVLQYILYSVKQNDFYFSLFWYYKIIYINNDTNNDGIVNCQLVMKQTIMLEFSSYFIYVHMKTIIA